MSNVTNIILITNGARPRLLEQTLRTLRDNTPESQYTLTLVCDGTPQSVYESENTVPPVVDSMLLLEPPCRIIGRLKNLGAYWSEKQFSRGEWLCFIDDDIHFGPEWLLAMKNAMISRNAVRILGGCRHPYHGVNEDFDGVFITDAVAGYSHFMRWSTWDRFGPYDAHAKGTGQSEDYALCRKIVDAGGKVGYIHPPAMAHCGLTSSEGKPILGAELIEKLEGILYE